MKGSLINRIAAQIKPTTMNKQKIDLSKCKPGQRVRLINGWNLVLKGAHGSNSDYPYLASNVDVSLYYRQDGTLQKGTVCTLDIAEVMQDFNDQAKLDDDVLKLNLLVRDICHQCDIHFLKNVIAALEKLLAGRLVKYGLKSLRS